ncbi:MAG: hypothetical protein Q7R64_00750 [bacterium]|nr:hypothetical protein [bacterium]
MQYGKNSNPEYMAKTAVTEAKVFFKKMFDINLDTFAQLGAPQFRSKAVELARNAKRRYHDTHWLRSSGGEVLYGVITSQLRTAAQALPDTPTHLSLLKTTVKETAGFIDGFVQEFCNKGNVGNVGVTSAELPKELHDALSQAGATLLADSMKLMTETPLSGREDMEKMLLARADTFARLKERIVHGIPKPEKTREPGVPLSEHLADIGEAFGRALKPLNDELEKGVAKLQAHNQTLREKKSTTSAPRSNSPGGRILRWLFK